VVSLSLYYRPPVYYARRERTIPTTSTSTEGPITLLPEGTVAPVGVAVVEGPEEAVVDASGEVVVEAPGATVVEVEEVLEDVVELEFSMAFL